MEASKLISVLVPVYNPGDRLRGCLDSLAAQTQAGLEVLLIDDGSTDGSLEIEREYASRRGDLFRLVGGEHGGVSAALNRGLEAARGAWIAFCDSDDVAEPELYSVLYGNALRHGADVSCCGLREIFPGGERLITTFPVKGVEVLSDRAEIVRRIVLELMMGTRTCYGYMVICMFRRSLIEDHGIRFPVGIPMREDEMFLMRCLLVAGKVVGTDRALYRYLRMDSSLCQTFYGRWNAFEREEIWVQLFREQCDIFAGSDLRELGYGWLEEVLCLRLYLHKAQMICCDGRLGMAERQKRLKALACDAGGEGVSVGGRGRLFWLLLFHGRWLLPVCLWARRLCESCGRRMWRLKRLAVGIGK